MNLRSSQISDDLMTGLTSPGRVMSVWPGHVRQGWSGPSGLVMSVRPGLVMSGVAEGHGTPS